MLHAIPFSWAILFLKQKIDDWSEKLKTKLALMIVMLIQHCPLGESENQKIRKGFQKR